ncbi:GtrA family protein [Streptomyces sp. NPDC004959]|uniref:GtrA family protein n=1 Tax=unclassified Streptomyces TaxID=2593676 RepID=UPI0033A20772
MTNASAPPSRLRRIVAELAKFGAVGGAGVLVNMAAYNLVRHFTSLAYVRASVIATVISIVFNYVGFRYFTYRDRDKSGRKRELGLFAVFSVIGLVIENGVLYAGTYGFGLDTPLQTNIVKFCGIGVATLFRFWSYRSWVFRALPPKDQEAVREVSAAVHEAEAAFTPPGGHHGPYAGPRRGQPSPVVAHHTPSTEHQGQGRHRRPRRVHVD